MKTSVASFLGAMFVAHLAYAGSVTSTTAVQKAAPLRLSVIGVTADCSWQAGTVVAQLSTTGGNGKAVVYTLGGTPSGDFAISGNTVVVGPNGIAAANCGTVENLQVVATQ